MTSFLPMNCSVTMSIFNNSQVRNLIGEIVNFLHLRDIFRLRVTCKHVFNLINSTASGHTNILFTKEFPESGWTWILPKLRYFQNYVVAGGNALHTYYGITGNTDNTDNTGNDDKNWESRDFDIFFYNQTQEQFLWKAFTFFKELPTDTYVWSWENRPNNNGFKHIETIKLDELLRIKEEIYLVRISGVHRTEYGYDVDTRKIIDLVYTRYKDAATLMRDFDFPFCGIGFVVDKYTNKLNFIESSKLCYQSARDKSCTVYLNSNLIGTENTEDTYNYTLDVLDYRIDKYKARGLTVKIQSETYIREDDKTYEEKTIRRSKNIMFYTF